MIEKKIQFTLTVDVNSLIICTTYVIFSLNFPLNLWFLSQFNPQKLMPKNETTVIDFSSLVAFGY